MRKYIHTIFLFFTFIFLTEKGFSQCAGMCGGSGSTFTCFCDDACWTFGDCCPDMCTACPGEGPNTNANCGGPPPPPPGGGCNTNTSICTPGLAGPFNFVTPGAQVSSCLNFIGPNVGYIILHITTSGPLNILIDGDATTGFLDVAIFNIPSGQSPCTAINSLTNEIGCNYAAAADGCNQFGSVFGCTSSVPAPNVVAGQELMIVVENWSGSSNNFTLQLGPAPGAQTGPPNPTITPIGSMCVSSPAVQLNAVDNGGTWTGPGVSPTGLFDPATAGVGTHTINYSIGTAPCNASSSTTITVTNFPAPPTFNAIAPICPGGTLNLPTTSNEGVTGTWSPAINNMATTTYTFTPTPGQCATTTTLTVNVGAPTTPTFTAIAPICPGGVISLPLTSNEGINGTWSPAINNLTTTTYTFTPSAGQCATTTTMTVNVGGLTTPTFTAIAPICTGSPIVLPLISTNGISGSWSPAINNTATTTYTFTPTAGQCASTTTMTVNVFTSFDATITPVAPLCESASSITLNAVDAGGTWSGNGITDVNAGTFNPQTAGVGTHTITYSISGACGDTQTLDIIVNPSPVVSFTALNTSGCVPVTTTFTEDFPLAGSTVEWTISNGFTTITPGSINYNFTIGGCYDVTLEVTNSQGCVGTSTQTNVVCVSENAIADFIWSPTNATTSEPTITFTNLTNNADTYTWDFAGLDSSNLTHPTFEFPSITSGVYTVCLDATNMNGCADSICYDIIIYDELVLYVPNSFTPNGDGKNDVFFPLVSGHNPIGFEFSIFNRWGEIIFQSENPENGWDGTSKGIKSKDDTYIWKIKVNSIIDDVPREFIGHVTMFR